MTALNALLKGPAQLWDLNMKRLIKDIGVGRGEVPVEATELTTLVRDPLETP